MADQVPAYLQKFMNQNSAMTEAMTSVSTSIPRISLKGRKFQFINGDDESKKLSEIKVSIIGVSPNGSNMIKTYYASGYDPSNTLPPDCSSTNGIVPDTWIDEPVSDNCKRCPMNAFGSAKTASGKKAKACKDSKRLWVVKSDDVEGTVYAMNVPITSIKNMAEYGKQVQKMGLPLAAIITKLEMDEDSEFPLIVFSQAGFMPEADGIKALERSVAKEWDIADQAALPMARDQKAIPDKTKKISNKQIEAAIDDNKEMAKGNVSDSDVDNIIDDWES